MAQNRISASLSTSDRDAVLAAITQIRQKLPFLIDLTSDERRALPKLGDKSRAFVEKALEVASQNPDLLPRSFDLEEMRKDVQLFLDMQPVMMAINQLQDLIDDTTLQSGSEAYAAALTVYTMIKNTDSGEALELAADDLGRRFARRSRQGSQARVTTPPAEKPPASNN